MLEEKATKSYLAETVIMLLYILILLLGVVFLYFQEQKILSIKQIIINKEKSVYQNGVVSPITLTEKEVKYLQDWIKEQKEIRADITEILSDFKKK